MREGAIDAIEKVGLFNILRIDIVGMW